MASDVRGTLYYGDNLDILRRHIANESVDLIYLDPPFKSNQDYNVLFAEQNGSRSTAQIRAFEDTWRWDQGAEAVYEAVVESGEKVSDTMQALREILNESGGRRRPPYFQPWGPATDGGGMPCRACWSSRTTPSISSSW